jgi:flagellar protein FliS
MDSLTYQQQATVGATGVQLIVALYDGALRGLYRAKQCVIEGDTIGRRVAVNKVVDIVMYLEARLRPDVGGSAAVALSDFYAAMFTLVLEASHIASAEGFDEVIACMRNVRDAWAIVAKDPEAGKVLPRELRTREEKFTGAMPVRSEETAPAQGTRWSA